MKCPKCEHENSIKEGFRVYKGGEKEQRYRCRYCGTLYVIGEERKKGRPVTEKGCKEEGCKGKGYSKGYCSKHYQAWYYSKKRN
jgi:transposase-like protein